MTAIIIKDLITLTDFFERAAGYVPGIEYFLALSNGEKAINEIETYYNDQYAGCTCFLQVAESRHSDNGAGLDSLTFLCSVTVAMKPTDVSPRAGLDARDQTQRILLALLGTIKLAVDESLDVLDDEGDAYEFSVSPSERMFPIGTLANVNLEGYYIDVDVTIPANHLLFPA